MLVRAATPRLWGFAIFRWTHCGRPSFILSPQRDGGSLPFPKLPWFLPTSRARGLRCSFPKRQRRPQLRAKPPPPSPIRCVPFTLPTPCSKMAILRVRCAATEESLRPAAPNSHSLSSESYRSPQRDVTTLWIASNWRDRSWGVGPISLRRTRPLQALQSHKATWKVEQRAIES